MFLEIGIVLKYEKWDICLIFLNICIWYEINRKFIIYMIVFFYKINVYLKNGLLMLIIFWRDKSIEFLSSVGEVLFVIFMWRKMKRRKIFM